MSEEYGLNTDETILSETVSVDRIVDAESAGGEFPEADLVDIILSSRGKDGDASPDSNDTLERDNPERKVCADSGKGALRCAKPRLAAEIYAHRGGKRPYDTSGYRV